MVVDGGAWSSDDAHRFNLKFLEEKMNKEKIIEEIEKTIRISTRKLRKKPQGPSSDILNSLSRLINSYRRLIADSENADGEEEVITDTRITGDPHYHARLLKSIAEGEERRKRRKESRLIA
jgi:hypothetical protein